MIASLGMYKVDYKGLPLRIILLGKDMWATFKAAVTALKKDTGATVMSKFKSFMSPLDHLQPEAAKSCIFNGRRSHETSPWCGQPEHGPPLLF